MLFDGTSFSASSPFITATLSPSSPPYLTAGSDLVVITSTSAVPEPCCSVLLITGFLFVARCHRKQE
jgi:hypothetical protein